MSQDDREAKITAALDKQEISELVQSFSNAADRHDHEKMRALYHSDAIDGLADWRSLFR